MTSRLSVGVRHGLQLDGIAYLWLKRLGLLQSQWIVGLPDRREFPPYFRGHWQFSCTTPTAGKCLSLWLCKELWKSKIIRRHMVGVTKPISTVLLISYFFSKWSKHLLPVKYHVYIWYMSPRGICGDTCHIWTWFKASILQNYDSSPTNKLKLTNGTWNYHLSYIKWSGISSKGTGLVPQKIPISTSEAPFANKYELNKHPDLGMCR